MVSIFGISFVPLLWKPILNPKTKTQNIPRHDQTAAQEKRNSSYLVIGCTSSRLLLPWLDLFSSWLSGHVSCDVTL